MAFVVRSEKKATHIKNNPGF